MPVKWRSFDRKSWTSNARIDEVPLFARTLFQAPMKPRNGSLWRKGRQHETSRLAPRTTLRMNKCYPVNLCLRRSNTELTPSLHSICIVRNRTVRTARVDLAHARVKDSRGPTRQAMAKLALETLMSLKTGARVDALQPLFFTMRTGCISSSPKRSSVARSLILCTYMYIHMGFRHR